MEPSAPKRRHTDYNGDGLQGLLRSMRPADWLILAGMAINAITQPIILGMRISVLETRMATMEPKVEDARNALSRIQGQLDGWVSKR